MSFTIHIPIFLVLLGFGTAGSALADDIPVSQLTQAVIQAIEQRFPGAVIEEAERETDDGQEVYEVEIEISGDDKEIRIRPNGEIVDIDD